MNPGVLQLFRGEVNYIKIPIPFTKRNLEINLGSTTDTHWLSTFGGRSYAGTHVNERKALQVSAVMACVKILSETIASLPLPVYKKLRPRGKERELDHPLYDILHDQANGEMTSFTWREVMQVHLALWGNAYCEIEYDDMWYVKGLWPLMPDRTFPDRDRKSGQVVFRTTLPNGQGVTLPQERVLHIPGLGFDGLKGLSPISMAREGIGLAMATEEYGARFFGNGAKPGGVLEHPGQLSDPARTNLRQSWNEMHRGLNNTHRIAILEEGMKYQQIGIPPEDAQFLETRKFQVTDIARIYRIPPHMIADLEKATFSNIEHQSIEFVVHAIRPWVVRWEQTMNWKLLTPKERKKFRIEFVIEGLLRGDTKSRYEAYAVGRQNGWLSPNDILELENMNPIPGGDKYLVPLNMIPADHVEEYWKTKTEAQKQKNAGTNASGQRSDSLEDVKSVINSLTKEEKKELGPRYFYDDAQYRYVNKQDGKPAGFIECRLTGTKGHVNLAVHADFRGQGLSNTLVETLLEEISDKFPDTKKIYWITSTDNASSIHLAEKYNFEKVKETEEGEVRYVLKL